MFRHLYTARVRACVALDRLDKRAARAIESMQDNTTKGLSAMTCTTCTTCTNRRALSEARKAAKQEAARLGFVIKYDRDNDEYRIAPRMSDKRAQERVAYYTDCVSDALVTMAAMHATIITKGN